MIFDWADLAFGSKKSFRDLDAVFIAAPRQISTKRFTQLVKEYLPGSHIVLGLAKEPFVDGLEPQYWFQTLKYDDVEPVITKVNAAGTKYQVHTLSYAQRELPYILDKIPFKHVVFINGSWYRAFHLRPEYHMLTSRGRGYSLVSPFTGEPEARAYAAKLPEPPPPSGPDLSAEEMMSAATAIAQFSLDHTGQVGAALASKKGRKYHPLLGTFNPVVPYQTYAMHHGSARERHFSPPGDQNHYDTNHAEVEMVIAAGLQGIDLTGTTLFINVLPCPSCARMFSRTTISEFVYSEDHSQGYALRLLLSAGKTVRRLVI